MNFRLRWLKENRKIFIDPFNKNENGKRKTKHEYSVRWAR